MKVNQLKLAFISISASLLMAACAGPHTPMGAVWTVDGSSKEKRNLDAANFGKLERELASHSPTMESPIISFDPSRQLLHDKTNLVIRVEDPSGVVDPKNLRVLYNKFDLGLGFMRQARSEYFNGGKLLMLSVPNFRLPPTQDHEIEVFYKNDLSDLAGYAKYLPPHCGAFDKQQVHNTGVFSVPSELMDVINLNAEKSGFNPSYLTALIAQESGFRNRSISWARAIGLTQVTPIAEKTILKNFPHWPRYPNLNKYPVAYAKSLIMIGRVNEVNEWRMNSRLSVQGGIAYLEYLVGYWNMPSNKEKIKRIFFDRDKEEVLSRLVLASYNSGATRVNNAIDKLGPDWLKSDKLREAHKYVNKINSFCHSFSDKGERNEVAVN